MSANAALTASDLRELADKLDGRQKESAEKELQERVDRMEAALARGGLSDEQQAVLDRAQKLLDDLDREDAAGERAAAGNGDGSGVVDPPEPPDPPAAKTRPGRKSGAAYDWTVDDTGKVVQLDVATVYSDDDEADEVELPA